MSKRNILNQSHLKTASQEGLMNLDTDTKKMLRSIRDKVINPLTNKKQFDSELAVVQYAVKILSEQLKAKKFL